ncbi:metallophosphoesterase family protein [Halohasta salina]|uniref:metallophosphoesterase family protein n=1 Tax=Halohasta salina TaxID=2961621 RepID=UPI0020A53D62|nr:metallophosphoesterase [Halohasta salina]
MSGRPLRNAGSTVMARLAAPTTSRPTRLAVLADPHVSTRADGSPKQFERTEGFLETAITDINSRDVDAVVSVGDLTKDGAPWDFARVDDLLSDLDAPFFAVPGNHDVPKTFDAHRSASRGRFIDRYTPGKLPYQVGVGGVDLLGLDSAWTPDGDLRESHDGRVTPRQLDWLADRAETADCPVVFTHHTLPPTARQAANSGAATGVDMSAVPIMRNGEAAMETLAGAGVPLALTGHIHLPGVAARETSTHTVTEVTAPSICTFPQAYLVVDIDSRGTTVRYVSTASPSESMAAYSARLDGTDIDRAQAAVGATRTAQFPLVEDWHPTPPPSTPSPTAPLSTPQRTDD